MDPDHTSFELLAHFDPIKDVDTEETSTAYPRRVRDARWVLKWTAAIAILVVAAATLLEFGYLMAAERTLNFAARAGAMEATLPRATYESVQAAVERRLSGCSQLQDQLQLTLLRNGQAVGKQLHAGDGVRFSVVLKAPASTALPAWLAKLTPWRSEQPLLAHAERSVSGRQLQRSPL
jgi:hypothetical protein